MLSRTRCDRDNSRKIHFDRFVARFLHQLCTYLANKIETIFSFFLFRNIELSTDFIKWQLNREFIWKQKKNRAEFVLRIIRIRIMIHRMVAMSQPYASFVLILLLKCWHFVFLHFWCLRRFSFAFCLFVVFDWFFETTAEMRC